MAMTIRQRQQLLKRRGFDPGPLDGVLGPQTRAATIAFKQSVGLRARDYVGPITEFALRTGSRPAPIDPAASGVDVPVWLRLAYSYLGLREIKGARHNAKILGWWDALRLPFRDDETPWCAGFVNGVLHESGLAIPEKYRAAALGWRWTGHGTRLDGPALGAVASMARPGRAGSGHMTFVAGRDSRGRIMGLGGNQGNAVSINPYDPARRPMQYHWPEGAPLPFDGAVGFDALPVITSRGSVLRNEA